MLISNQGVEMKDLFGYKVHRDGSIVGKRGQILSPRDNGRGYLILGIMKDGRRVTFGVHRLVALAFIPNPLNLPEINHRDGNKYNNCVENLEWCTRGLNIEHAYRNNLRSALGENNARCKTTESEVRRICKLIELGHSSAKIRDAGYDYDLVRAIKSKKNWRSVSNEYSF